MSEADLARKVRVRAGHRGSAKRLLTQAEACLTAEPLVAADLETVIASLNRKLEALAPLDAEILELTPDDNVEEEIDHADQHQEQIRGVLVRLNKALAGVATPRTPPAPTASVPPSEGSPARTDPPADRTPADRTPTAHGTKVKLPKLTLPRFSGTPTKWTAFWDSYESAIHTNDELSKVDKFNYLRSLLEGSAFEAVRGLTLSAANYEDAIGILKKRFGNRQLIVAKHMETLLNIDPVTSDQNLRGLRKLYNDVETNTRSLKAMGVEPETYGTMLSSVLLGKLPTELRLIVSRKTSDTELTLTSLQEVLEEELTARERSVTPRDKMAPSSQGHSRHRSDRSERLSAATLLSGTYAMPTCSYCRQSHASSECTTVTEMQARREILKSSGRCYNCLRRGHVAGRCKSRSLCQRCKKKHHTSICEEKGTHDPDPPAPSLPKAPPLNPEAAPFESTATTLVANETKTVLLQTARARIYNPSSSHLVADLRVLLDSGSQRSYMTERARRLLKLETEGEQRISIAAFGSVREDPKVRAVVKIGMELEGHPHLYPSLLVVPMICEPLVGQPISECIQANPRLATLQLADLAEADSALPVDILIGADYYWEVVTGKVCRGERGPTGIHTKLGWVLSGPTQFGSGNAYHTNVAATHVLLVDTQLDQRLQSFWDLETLGIRAVEKTVYDEFSESITFSEGRYQVSLPWKQQHRPLPDNYTLSLRRLEGLLKRLRQTPDVLRKYDDIIREQFEAGIVEDVPPDSRGDTQIHYLPHHAVIREDKSTTKLRVVYDASAKTEGNPSLNDCLHVGPKLNQKILDLLVRFRAHRVAVTADIEKAFLMVAVDKDDRDALRFLWVHDTQENPPRIRSLRFTRVVFGVSSSPFLLNATIRYHLERYKEASPDLIQRLLDSFYVDDLTTGASSEEEAHSLYAKTKRLLGEGGFNLRKFRTNRPSLQEVVDAGEGAERDLGLQDESYTDATLGVSQTTGPQETKILGVRWNPQTDCLMFGVSDIARAAQIVEPTKRNVVSVVGKIYDPLGFLAPVVLRFKLLFQKLCVNKVDWDQPLTSPLLDEWNSLVKDLLEDVPISIPRCYLHGIEDTPRSITLCGFCDASLRAYAAVVYLRVEAVSGTKVQFVVSKTRVAPVQDLTIPRLELLSALLLARLVAVVSDDLKSLLPLSDVKCYTDSTVALFWIRGTERNWKPFVNNRVTEIRNLVPPDSWSHCPGLSNPADLPSRGLSTLELSLSLLWRQGPPWLVKQDFDAAQGFDEVTMPRECEDEMKVSKETTHNLLITTQAPTVGSVIKSEGFSTLTRLIRVTAYVLRAVNLFKRSSTKPTGPPSVDELLDVERRWVTDTQMHLRGERNLRVWEKQFGLFSDDRGLIRCRGRLDNSNLPYATKYPLFLPRKSHFTTLVVRQAHSRVMHNGVKETLTEVRRRYWIVKGRSLIRSIIHHCVTCKRHEGLPFKTPTPPALPAFRIQEQPAFTFTGVDYAGPLYTRSQEARKVWICLFTCCVTRALHLEVVTDMSTDSFIRCLKRFAARRGMPKKMLSDNGKTFKAAAVFLERVFKDHSVITYLSTFGTEWVFNVEKAPWWGGVFERLVKSTKRCLRKFIGQAKFSLDELHTAVVEVESIINSRPLSYVSSSDLEEPLTPSHLISGKRIVNLPDDLGYRADLDDGDFTISQDQVRKRVKYGNLVLNHFWKRWRQEYLAELRESHRSYTQQCTGTPTISVGDVVVIHEDSLPRGFWRLGVVEELLKGPDGVARGALVRVAPKEGGQTHLRRPIQRLYPLEVHQDPPQRSVVQGEQATGGRTGKSSREQDDLTPDKPDDATRSRPKRAAAGKARDTICTRLEELSDSD